MGYYYGHRDTADTGVNKYLWRHYPQFGKPGEKGNVKRIKQIMFDFLKENKLNPYKYKGQGFKAIHMNARKIQNNWKKFTNWLKEKYGEPKKLTTDEYYKY